MRHKIFLYCLILLLFEINCLLPPEKREELMRKYTKEIRPDSFDPYEEDFSYDDSLKAGYNYDVNKINEILTKYDFPLNFNFLEAHNITPIVKNQKKCGCCWSHAATSALGYRYSLKGLNLSLSPQDALSCYVTDCDHGNWGIDAQMNLVKNGTVTEECLPFTSGDGNIVDKCPTETCADGVTKPKKYFSQKAFYTFDFLSEDSYYDIVTLIIDQLIYRGPVVADIIVYDDFVNLHRNTSVCTNETIYTYDGKSEVAGGHAITVVGYGFLNGKFYWQIQNSWGPNVCDNGFIKIEFGQADIETVSFSDPYIEPEQSTPYEIGLKYEGIDGQCNFKLSFESESDINHWDNSLEIRFMTEDQKNHFNFHCAVTSSNKTEKQFGCFFEIDNYYRKRRNFTLSEYSSLGKENNFIINPKIDGFYYHGYDFIFNGFSGKPNIFVSGEGSKIILLFDEIDADKDYLPHIYANIHAPTPLSDCKRKILPNDEEGNHYLVVCDLKEEEIAYFDDFSEENKNDIVYDYLCGGKDITDLFVYKFNKTKYPVFKVKKAYLKDSDKIKNETRLLLETVNIGVISEDFVPEYFLGYAFIENDKGNQTYHILCHTGTPRQADSEYNMTCSISINKEKGPKDYKNVYILPFTRVYDSAYPFEVLIDDIIKIEKPKPEPVPTYSPNNLEFSLITLILIVLLF